MSGPATVLDTGDGESGSGLRYVGNVYEFVQSD